MWLLCQTDLQVGKSVYYLVPVVGHPTSQQAALGKSRIPDIGSDHQVWAYAWESRYIGT